MSLNIYLGAAKSHCSVCAKETFDQVSRFWFNVRWEFVVAVHDLLINAEWVVIVERRVTSQHLKNQDSQSPPVDELIMAL